MTDAESTEETGEEAPDPVWDRKTAPQSPYTMRQVGIGVVVLIVAAIVAYGLPLALA